MGYKNNNYNIENTKKMMHTWKIFFTYIIFSTIQKKLICQKLRFGTSTIKKLELNWDIVILSSLLLEVQYSTRYKKHQNVSYGFICQKFNNHWTRQKLKIFVHSSFCLNDSCFIVLGHFDSFHVTQQLILFWSHFDVLISYMLSLCCHLKVICLSFNKLLFSFCLNTYDNLITIYFEINLSLV